MDFLMVNSPLVRMALSSSKRIWIFLLRLFAQRMGGEKEESQARNMNLLVPLADRTL